MALLSILKVKKSDALFVCKDLPGSLNSEIQNSGFGLKKIPANTSLKTDQEKTLKYARIFKPDLVLVDSYDLDWRWEQALYLRYFTLVIDDQPKRRHLCHLLIDTNFRINYANCYDSLIPSHATKLLGPNNSILRPEFIKVRPPPIRKRKGVVVFFGTGDAGGETYKFLCALNKQKDSLFKDEPIHVVVSKQNSKLSEIKKLKLKKQIKLTVNAPNLAKLFSNSKLFIGSGGTVTWERMACGLPGLIVAVADNQIPAAQSLAKKHFHIYAGKSQNLNWQKLIDKANMLYQNTAWLKTASTLSRKLVVPIDPSAILCIKADLRLRLANAHDSQFLYNLRNEPLVKEASKDQQSFSYSDHKRWLLKKLNEKGSLLSILVFNNEPVGQVRIDKDKVVSISIGPKGRGRGLADRSLVLAILLHKQVCGSSMQSYTAYIKRSNLVSQRVFLKAGFRSLHKQVGLAESTPNLKFQYRG